MGVSENRGTPKSSILRGFSIINHPFWGTPIVGNIHVFSTTIKALISIEASALSLGAAAEPKGHSSQGSAPSPRRLVGGLS